MAPSAEQRVQWVAIGVAGYLLLDTLLLIPVLAVAFRWPNLLWPTLGAYLVFTVALLVAGGYLMHQWGLLELDAPVMRGTLRFLGALALLTVALVVAVALWPEWVWIALLLYLAATGYAIYWVLKWSVVNLAFQCDLCGAIFQGSLKTWLLSPSLGTRKYLSCPSCGKGTLARVVSAHRLREEGG